MKFLLYSLALPVMLMLSLTACKSDTKNATYKQISMEEGTRLIETEADYIILDVRRADEFLTGHIPGAVNLSLEEIEAINVGEEIPLLPQKDKLILVYCRSGRRSKLAAEKLVTLGYTNITEFGGILDWQGEIEV